MFSVEAHQRTFAIHSESVSLIYLGAFRTIAFGLYSRRASIKLAQRKRRLEEHGEDERKRQHQY